jgi:hypothetical protein
MCYATYMTNAETVKIQISIQIDTESDEGGDDTGLTVAEWNSLTNAERSKIYRQMWDDMAANGDNGGAHVVTAGAEEI